MVVDGRFGRFQCRFEKGVGVSRENDGERDTHAIDPHIVGHHLTLYQVFFRTRIDDGGQCVIDQFGIECHSPQPPSLPSLHSWASLTIFSP